MEKFNLLDPNCLRMKVRNGPLSEYRSGTVFQKCLLALPVLFRQLDARGCSPWVHSTGGDTVFGYSSESNSRISGGADFKDSNCYRENSSSSTLSTFLSSSTVYRLALNFPNSQNILVAKILKIYWPKFSKYTGTNVHTTFSECIEGMQGGHYKTV